MRRMWRWPRKPWAGAGRGLFGEPGLRLPVRPRTCGGRRRSGPCSIRCRPGGRGCGCRCSVRVRVGVGQRCRAASEADVLNGANVAALRSATAATGRSSSSGRAELIAPREYRARRASARAGGNRRRDAGGLAGRAPTSCCSTGRSGSWTCRPRRAGVERHYRVGPATRAYDDPSYVHRVETFAGVGLRPYRPAHLVARARADGAIELAWTRRTRIDGDSWAGHGRAARRGARGLPRARRSSGGALLREVDAECAALRLHGGRAGRGRRRRARSRFEVAQVSVRFGPGPFERIEFDG